MIDSFTRLARLLAINVKTPMLLIQRTLPLLNDGGRIITVGSMATRIAVSGQIGKFDYAAELKNASLSSRPESWDATDIGFEHHVSQHAVRIRLSLFFGQQKFVKRPVDA